MKFVSKIIFWLKNHFHKAQSMDTQEAYRKKVEFFSREAPGFSQSLMKGFREANKELRLHLNTLEKL